YFQHHPCVRRVVFLGTPHHGVKLSATPAAKLAAHLVQLPRGLIEAARDVAQQNPGAEFRFTPDRLPSSLKLLWPGDPALELLAAQQRPADVHFHSIVGLITQSSAERAFSFGAAPEKTDGVVTYASAHVDVVDSECVVPA